jgi:hypothetical protein
VSAVGEVDGWTGLGGMPRVYINDTHIYLHTSTARIPYYVFSNIALNVLGWKKLQSTVQLSCSVYSLSREVQKAQENSQLIYKVRYP